MSRGPSLVNGFRSAWLCLCRREWVEDTQLWIQQVSSTPSTRMDVVHLQEQLDLKLQQRQARETGICPVRRELYSQCFGEWPGGGVRYSSASFPSSSAQTQALSIPEPQPTPSWNHLVPPSLPPQEVLPAPPSPSSRASPTSPSLTSPSISDNLVPHPLAVVWSKMRTAIVNLCFFRDFYNKHVLIFLLEKCSIFISIYQHSALGPEKDFRVICC